MRWSLQIARIRGIAIRVHVSFLLVLPLLAPLFAAQLQAAARAMELPPPGSALPPLLWGVLMTLGLFAAVLLHELAHALYAVAHGGKVRSITLLMIGGVTHLEETPRRPGQEALMALVGPLTSLVLGVLLLLLSQLLADGAFTTRFALATLGGINLALGIFNLLPAFPMDGGRILRALLTPRLGPVRATQAAARVGQVFALLFGLAGLLGGNIFLLLIAFFVFMGAQAEAQQVLFREGLEKLTVGELMSPRPAALEAGTSLEEALEMMRRERHLALPVLGAGPQAGRPVGVLTLPMLQRVEAAARATTPVSAVLQQAPTLRPEEDAWSAVRRLGEARLPLLPVVDEAGVLVGTLEERDLMQALALQQARTSRGLGPGGRREAPA